MQRSPKQTDKDWYPFHAGYSEAFVSTVIEAESIPRTAKVLDPWCGAGTTLAAARTAGLDATGVDANPVSIVLSRARLLDKNIVPNVESLALDIIEHARELEQHASDSDALRVWFAPSSAATVRSIDRGIRQMLAKDDQGPLASNNPGLSSPLTSFFATALFLSVRTLSRRFASTNPTWFKVPKTQNRPRPSPETVYSEFISAVNLLKRKLQYSSYEPRVTANLGDSRLLTFPDSTFDLVVTSPPYATRLDYVVSTRPELAVLNTSDTELADMRTTMVGSPTLGPTPRDPADVRVRFASQYAGTLLDAIRSHPSKASRTYYHRFYSRYFDSIERSLHEISRVLTSGGVALVVVQDSFYKNVRVDLQQICIENRRICQYDSASTPGLRCVESDRVNAPIRSDIQSHNSSD